METLRPLLLGRDIDDMAMTTYSQSCLYIVLALKHLQQQDPTDIPRQQHP
jgi:hypothetical protein